MKACRTASIVAAIPVGALVAIGACRNPPPPTPIPPLTTAKPETLGRIDPNAGVIPNESALLPEGAARADVPPPKVAFVDAPGKVEDGLCVTTLVAAVKGNLSVWEKDLAPGDVAVAKDGKAADLKGAGLAVVARTALGACVTTERPAPVVSVVRGGATPKQVFAAGKMTAQLDVGTNLSPGLYLGRLDGTAAVAEHTHPTSWEIVASIEAAGTFTLDGKESRLGPRQIVMVPPAAKHAWKPDPGAKLVAIQMYAPPGPEQRFLSLAAAEKADAGKP
jgi:hypothetical protein